MSPSPLKKGTPKTLTVEFSGISTLVWNKTAGSATVQLVDLASAGFDRHYPALGLVVNAALARGVKGPDADAAVSLPGTETDVGLWNLLGAEVEFVGAIGKLTLDDSKVDVTKKPGKNVESINWLANVATLADSNALSPLCPTAATISLPAGRITAKNVAAPGKIEFVSQGVPVGPARYCVSRFQAVVPFDDEIAIRIDKRRVLRFSDSHTVMISNTCVCGLGVNQPPDHFMGHYNVVRAKRRPQIRKVTSGPGPEIAEWPDLCLAGFVEV